MKWVEELRNWSFRRSVLIAKVSYLEAVRMRLFYALLALALFSLGSSFLLQEFNFGSDELKFIMDFGFGGMTFFGSIFTIVASSQLFYGEIENRTAFTILAKPIRRSEFLFGKFLGAWLSVVSFVATLSVCLTIALFARETVLMSEYPDYFSSGRSIIYGDLVGFALLQCIRLGILGSLVVLFSSYATSALFSIILGVLVWVLGQLQYLASMAWGAYDSFVLNCGLFVISILLPNFHLYDLGDRLALGAAIEWQVYLQLFCYGSLYIALYLSLAVVSFKNREL